MSKIINFTIIAHVDSGKSTLSDRLMELCLAIDPNKKNDQLLDSMDLEKEKGITIKAQTVRLNWKGFTLNLIDTPGHADFSYEVNRSLKAVETSILLIDVTKGVEAQTLSHCLKAKAEGHFILPVINKIDSVNNNKDQEIKCLMELSELVDISHCCFISAKLNLGVEDMLNKLIELAPLAKQNLNDSLKALIVDSWYDKYSGVVVLLRIFSGTIETNQNVYLHFSNKNCSILKIGFFLPKRQEVKKASAGEICYVVLSLKQPSEVKVGDTISIIPTTPIEGFEDPKPMVWCCFLLEDSSKIKLAKDSLDKYLLNDSAFTYTMENSEVFGVSFRCGFLGLLHMEVVIERLLREFGINFIPTLPSVSYKVLINGKEQMINNPKQWIKGENYEPECSCIIWTTSNHIGSVTSLSMERRAENLEINEKSNSKVLISCKLPLSEIIIDFNEKLKGLTSGYGSIEIGDMSWRLSDLCIVFILINDKEIEELSFICHKSKSKQRAFQIVSKLAEIIPRSQVKIKIQGAVNTISNIVCREDIQPYRKDVIAKCYGGDLSRKTKLLDKQKRGKEKMFDKNEMRALTAKQMIEIMKV